MAPLIERMFRYTWFLATERRDAMLREGRGEYEVDSAGRRSPRAPRFAPPGRRGLIPTGSPNGRIPAPKTGAHAQLARIAGRRIRSDVFPWRLSV